MMGAGWCHLPIVRTQPRRVSLGDGMWAPARMYPARPQPDAQPQRMLTSREEAMEKARGRIGGMRSNR